MRVQVTTMPIPFVAGRDSFTQKETDLSQPGNRKWLLSHLQWAAKNNKVVTLSPLSN